METTKELKIEIPTGYEIDKNKSNFEKIVFKKKDSEPRSWQEYCEQEHYNEHEGYFINNGSCIIPVSWDQVQIDSIHDLNCSRNILPAKELAESFLAMMQLMSLRHGWIHRWSIDRGMTYDWKANFSDALQFKWCVVIDNNRIITESFFARSRPLAFPTKEIATDFIDTFKDLIEVAKPLL